MQHARTGTQTSGSPPLAGIQVPSGPHSYAAVPLTLA
jgi:hypothetical protein